MRILIALTIVGLLSGCFVETMTTTATQTQNAVNAAESGLAAKEFTQRTVGKAEAQQAVNAYQAETGKYPKTLKALVPDYLETVPIKADGSAFEYDPRTGKISN